MTIIKIIAIIWVIGAIIILVEKLAARTKISKQMNSDPASAVETAKKGLKSDALTLDEYVRQLTKIAEGTGYAGAMLALAEHYSGENYKNTLIRDDEKCNYWKLRAVRAGDINSIIEYYGFTDYDVTSNMYEDMLRDLNTAGSVAVTEGQRASAAYFSGIVNYKMGKLDTAKQLFTSISFPELAGKSNYMTFRCFVQENNISAAEKVLTVLENEKFPVSAADYLILYDYYVAKRNNGQPSYEAEIKYVKKYVSSKDADRATANRIGGSTHYNLALAFQNGLDGLAKDTEKMLEAYEEAAMFENVEALYYLGERYWNGSLNRNYSKANAYLLKAAQKGHKQAQELLQKFGVDGILIKPMLAENTTYQFLGGYKLTASKNTMNWLQLYNGIQYKSTLIAGEFSNKYVGTFKSFDQMLNGVNQLYCDYAARMLRWCLMLLMSFDIDIYDSSDIIGRCEDLSLLPRVPAFEQGIELIDERAAQLNLKLNYAQATRGSWSGAGFGTTIGSTIAATAKASVTAGVMNIGSGILHGIGDSIVKSMNNAEIKNMGKKLFDDPNTLNEFSNAINDACLDIGDVTLKLIENHLHIRPESLSGSVIFEGESLSDIDDKALTAKINNNLSAGKYEYAYALLVEALRRHPLDGKTFEQMAALTVRRNKTFTGKEYDSILRYIGDFQIDVRNFTIALKNLTHNTTD